MRPSLYTLPEIAKELRITMAQMRGCLANKKNPPPEPISLHCRFNKSQRKYYNKEQFINWYRSRRTI